MKQEFITSKGKVINERNILFIKYFKLPFSETVLYKVLFGFLPPIMLISFLFFLEGPIDFYFKVLLWLLFTVNNFNHLWDVLVRLSFSNRIPLDRITAFDVKDDINGLETIVTLTLKSGRKRIIPFRTLEKQYEPFTELITQQIAQPQFA
jgi:hypothetical protein